MKKVLFLLILPISVWAQAFNFTGIEQIPLWRDSSGILVPRWAGRKILFGSPTSGTAGFFTRNGTAPQSGTLSPATATDTVSFGTGLFSGNVGIGMTNPGAKLNIANASSTSYPTLGTNPNSNLFLGSDNNLYGLFEGSVTADGNSWLQVMKTDVVLAYNLILQPVGGNVGIGAITFPSTGTKTLIFGSDSIVPAGMPTNRAGLYADTVAGVMELRAMDGAGNKTTISPHNFSLFQPDSGASLPWSFTSTNEYIGKEIAVDMWKLAQLVEQLTGKKLIYEQQLADSLVRSWDANEEYHYQESVKQRQQESVSFVKIHNEWVEKTKGLKDEEIDWTTEPKPSLSPVYTKKAPPAWLKSRLKIPSKL